MQQTLKGRQLRGVEFSQVLQNELAVIKKKKKSQKAMARTRSMEQVYSVDI